MQTHGPQWCLKMSGSNSIPTTPQHPSFSLKTLFKARAITGNGLFFAALVSSTLSISIVEQLE